MPPAGARSERCYSARVAPLKLNAELGLVAVSAGRNLVVFPALRCKLCMHRIIKQISLKTARILYVHSPSSPTCHQEKLSFLPPVTGIRTGVLQGCSAPIGTCLCNKPNPREAKSPRPCLQISLGIKRYVPALQHSFPPLLEGKWSFPK